MDQRRARYAAILAARAPMNIGKRDDPSAITIDPLTGRDCLVHPAAARELRDQLVAAGPEELASEDSKISRRRWHTEIGQLSRLLGEFEISEYHLEHALELTGADLGATGLARLRLAQLWQLRGTFERSDPALELALVELRGSSVEHFAWQQMGRNHVAAGRPDKARYALERALRLREQIGDDELITSTKLALALLRP